MLPVKAATCSKEQLRQVRHLASADLRSVCSGAQAPKAAQQSQKRQEDHPWGLIHLQLLL